jgi:GT2 family glycosyltransferase
MLPDLSICIVNHRTSELTHNCLRSIADTRGDLAIEVLLVNNTPDACPTDDINLPLTFIQNEKPLGFAANQNQMLRLSTGRYMLPLNSDTLIHPQALQALVNFMDDHPQCGIAGPRLLNADGTLQPSCHNFPSPIPMFMEVSGRWQYFKGSRLIGKFLEVCSPHDEIREVDWVIAACIIVRRESTEQVGLFDEVSYPYLFAEDLDWCWRMNLAGYKVMFTPYAVVTHLENQSYVPMREVESHRSTLTFLQKYYSPWQVKINSSAIKLAVFLKWLLIRDPERRASLKQVLALY